VGVREGQRLRGRIEGLHFGQLAFLYGQPPKGIWLRVGNQPTQPIAELLRTSVGIIARFGASSDEALLVLPDLGSSSTSPVF
jgi:hypothetical protein